MTSQRHINAEMHNIPKRVQQGLIAVPWEFSMFKMLSNTDRSIFYISADKLIDNYIEFMKLHKLLPIPKEILLEQLDNIKFTSDHRLIEDENNYHISYQSFCKSLKWYAEIQKYYCQSSRPYAQILDVSKKKIIITRKNGLLLLTTIIDALVALIILLKSNLPIWLIVAKSSAVIILTNMAYILIPFIRTFNFVPDRIIANLLPSEYTTFYHKVFGIKIFIASVSHVIGHYGQVAFAINNCKNGCSRDSIKIVPYSKTQIVISYGYFAKQYAYITGFILVIIFLSQIIFMGLQKYKYTRYSFAQTMHKYLAMVGIAMTIAHGCSQLLGFNFALIIVLPLFLLFCWTRRHEIIHNNIVIERWLITQSVFNLYLKDNDVLDKALDSFNKVIVYVNHPEISRIEWHPFSLTRGYESTNAIIAIKRVGKWTNTIANLLTNKPHLEHRIKIGYYIPSKFRFYYLYDTRYFFCAGIGITGFTSVMIDMLKTDQSKNTQTTLIWSVADVNIITQFANQIIDWQSKFKNFNMKIYYSNRMKSASIIPNELKLNYDYLQSLIFGYYKIDIATGRRSPVCCSLQRVDFIDILSKAIVSANLYGLQSPIGIFICGPYQYTNQAIASVKQMNQNKYGIQLRTWAEEA